MNADFARTKKCVDHYRSLGLCPLPSRMDCKGPLLPTYVEHYQGAPVPEAVYDDWQTTNVQIVTGVNSPTPTKIIAVDIDSDTALSTWMRICARNKYVPREGWIAVTGSGGRHHYFLVPPGVESCPSGMIYGIWDTYGEDGKGQWMTHMEIRILGDNSLVVAPPSIHVKTGKRYEFLPPSPNVYRLPEVAPDWLLAMPRLVAPRCVETPKPRPAAREFVPSGSFYTREEVLEAIGDRKWDLAVGEWGLSSACSGPNANGWCCCYVPGREDPRYSRPSGSFNYVDGTLQDRKDLSTISFFDLGVLLGHFHTWQECRDSLGDRFIGRKPEKRIPRFVF